MTAAKRIATSAANLARIERAIDAKLARLLAQREETEDGERRSTQCP